MGDSAAQRDYARPGIQDEQGGVPHLRREQERRVLRLRKVRYKGGETRRHKHEPPLMPNLTGWLAQSSAASTASLGPLAQTRLLIAAQVALPCTPRVALHSRRSSALQSSGTKRARCPCRRILRLSLRPAHRLPLDSVARSNCRRTLMHNRGTRRRLRCTMLIGS